MPTDGAIAKFLYTILKQLDLKSVRLLCWSNLNLALNCSG